MHPLAVVIDTREQQPYAFPGSDVAVVVGALPAGDYSLVGHEARVAVERKELDDFVHTVIYDRDRWLRELRALGGYAHALVVIEASLRDILEESYTARVRWECVVGEIVTLLVAWRIPVVLAGDRQAAQMFVEKWLRKVAETQGNARRPTT